MTSLTITLDDATLEELRRRAAERGITVEEVAAEAVRQKYDLERVLRPVRDAFVASGMTEDELGDLFEAERESMHREHREPDPAGPMRGERMVEQMRGTATRRVTAEEIYEHTRSDL